MGDYVLESNPALGRLIERLATESAPPAREKSSHLFDSTRYRRRNRAKASKRAREDPIVVVEKKRAKNPRVARPADPTDALAVEDHLWAIREDSGADDMGLVDLDEGPAVFAEEIGGGGGDTFEDGADEILDVYGRTDPDEDGESACSAVENEEGDWIIDAFKAWMLKAVEAPG